MIDIPFSNLDPFNDLAYIQYYEYDGSGDLYDYPESALSIYSPGK